MPEIHILDVTNRDGVQAARTGLSKFGKTMVNFYLGKLGVAQSEIGFPFLAHEQPYVRAQTRLAAAGAFGNLRLSGWCRGVAGDVEKALPLGLEHYNLSISTSDYMIQNKFRGRLDRDAILREMTQAVRLAKSAGATTVEEVMEHRLLDTYITEEELMELNAGRLSDEMRRTCAEAGAQTAIARSPSWT